ncbi:phospho-N-acetylmuramoyl-pentapeptide-transferase [Convivina intestini]|uniref:phospho-N-acetylmuramoyl-pentapeptide- transferase n=1 Tax=Convivina intestini TaxID=1505726 RepID=UPI00200D14D1|nr:phospho-N-acetylmuramoyl-pentapeptide-transferase [Convivina intestini]CAH1854695.1 Phospho-N-acetylmuramoyl-pentapeptide-transferase [Convivina intestini]
MKENFLVFLIALIITVGGMPFVIKFLRQSKEQAVIRKLGPDHRAKAGTPSMGGALFIAATIIATLCMPGSYQSWTSFTWTLILIVAVGSFAVIGGIDDALKLIRHADEGFAFKPKLLAQTLSAVLMMLLMWALKVPFIITIPWVGPVNLGIFYFFFLWFWLVGWSNATNLTDGLDGLLAGTALIVYGAFTILAWRADNPSIVTFNFAIMAALIGFLFYNHPKAKIFMGDTGSLALGAGLAIESILLHASLSLLWFGLVFVIETLSVIIQTFSYHFYHKRVFPMAPIHHTFEKMGWSEWQIDGFFWAITLVLAVIGVNVIG